MATVAQRVKAIADALINGSATNQQIARLVNGNLGLTAEGAATLSDLEKGQRFLFRMRHQLKQNVIEHEQIASVVAAQAAVVADVEAAFTEAP